MRILHTYCLNYNLGDYALGIGVKNLLRQHLDVDLIGETNLQGTLFNSYYIEEVVNKRYDLLVIGGGGVIHGAHWPNGWFWLIKEENIRKIKIPFIVYGVGYNYFKDEGGIPEIGRSHLKETIKRAAYFSLRNDGSVDRFKEQMGIEVPEVPDPGFHMNLNKTYSCPEKASYVIVQLANDKPAHRFGSDENKARFIADMRAVVSRIAKDHKVIFAPHVLDDVSLSQEIAGGIENAFVWDFSKYAFDNVAESIAYYQDAHYVLAMRGHGQILPMAFNVPVISIENHPKHSGLMRRLGLENYNVSLREDGFRDKLTETIRHLETNKDSYVKKLLSKNAEMLKDSQDAFEVIRTRILS
ncbi:MAG TPA: polysaccharide pyruvyl transferase family protein [bacterium]|nr:polysaccharide pyruvyl transferase family protein [bacterium]